MQISAHQPRPLEIEMTIPVRSYDIDHIGVVSNIVYVRWLEDLRVKFLIEHFPKDQIKQATAHVLAKTQIEYKSPIQLFDQVLGRLWVNTFERVRWTLQIEILSNSKLAASATQIGTFINIQTSRPVPIPEILLKKHHDYLCSIE
jgi:acyl-CoA thioester hydrolase